MSNLARGWGYSLIQQSTAVVWVPAFAATTKVILDSQRYLLRRAHHPGVEMRQPRHHFLLQQPQRVVPGLRLVLVVEAEHQQRAKAADLAIDLFDFFGDGRRR